MPTTNKLAASIVVAENSKSFSFLSDFSWTIARFFLEDFLASKTKLTEDERSTLQNSLSILKKYLKKK